jgi:DNA (cytosine-5)-methyltransferase 1
MNIIDLFAGSGGLSEGFRNENYNIICHIEMNYQASQSLMTREAFYYLIQQDRIDDYNKYLEKIITKKDLYNLVPSSILKKVINVEISNNSIYSLFDKIDNLIDVNDIDGIVGGPPCQAFSMIGRPGIIKKKNLDKRAYLYEYYVMFLSKYKPKFFVFENVKGLLSFKNENNEYLFPIIFKAFESIGYKVNYKVINASSYGVSQNRERVYIFGFRNDISDIDFFKSLEKHKETPLLINELFEDLPKLYSGEMDNNYRCKAMNDMMVKHYRKYGVPLTLNSARFHNTRDLEIYRTVLKEKNKGIQVKYGDLPEELRTHSNTTGFLDRFKALNFNEVSHTVVAHIAKDGHYYIHPDIEQNRSITVREAARLQSFPDDYFFEGSRTDAFTQIGNAVPPILSKKIAVTILELIK